MSKIEKPPVTEGIEAKPKAVKKTKKIINPLPEHIQKAQDKAAALREQFEKMPKQKRIPLRQQKKIGVEKKKGMHTRLVNDEGDRIVNFMKAGHNFREDEVRMGEQSSGDASQFGKVACQPVGGGIMGYYMDIPEEYWEEDQAKKQAQLDAKDALLGAEKMDPKRKRGNVKMNFGPLED